MDQTGARDMRRFLIGLGTAGAVSAMVAAVLLFPVFNRISTPVDDVSETLAALVAAGACFWAARSVPAGRHRLAPVLLGISAGSWGLGQLAYSFYEVGLGVDVPSPSLADAGFIISIPFAFAAVRAYWSAPRGTPSRWRVWLDALIIVMALAFTAWALGLRLIVLDNTDALSEKALELVYPVGDILILTVLILGLRRATAGQHFRMFLLLAGLAANALADSAFAYLTINGASTVHGSVLDAGWVVGYLLIGLAVLAPKSHARPVAADSPVDLWQLALPWITIAGAGVSAIGLALTHQPLDLFLTATGGLLALLLTVNMVLNNRDFLGMLSKSRISEARLADIVKRAPLAIARAGTDYRIIDANPGLEALLRQPAQELVGLTFDRYISVEQQPDVFQKLGRLASGEVGTVDGEFGMIRSDGTRVWTHWTSAAVRSASGDIDYFLTMLEDVDARHQADASAKASLETLERLNTLKTEFLHNVSHEFKTALIGIQGFSEFMRDSDELNVQDARAFAADIYRDAARLDRMVTEMVALDQVESSRAVLRVERVDLDAVIRAQAELLKREVHGNRMVLALQPELPAVAGDPDKLADVVRTLLQNAVKRSPEGGTITVSARVDGSGVQMYVKDQGVGAQSEFDNRLFGVDDLYANNPIRKVVGTGLGLGIARQVIEMHGGRFWVDGGGSEFHFSIPVLWKDREAAIAAAGSPRVA